MSRSGAVLAALLVVLGVCCGSARAAFPGANGQVLYSNCWDAMQGGLCLKALDDPTAGTRVPLDLNINAASFSPDGRRIAVLGWPHVADAPEELHVVGIDGSDDRVLASGMPKGTYGLKPAWSPDGAQIAFPCPQATPPQAPAICTIPVAGGTPTKVLDGQVRSLAWSPAGGGTLAFARDVLSDGCISGDVGYSCDHVFLAAPDGSNVRELAVAPNRTDFNGRPKVHYDTRDVEFSPDGGQVVFGSTSGVMACPVDPAAGPCDLSRPRVTTTQGGDRVSLEAVAPDGRSVLVAVDHSRLWQVDLAGCQMNQTLPSTDTLSFDWQPLPGPATAAALPTGPGPCAISVAPWPRPTGCGVRSASAASSPCPAPCGPVAAGISSGTSVSSACVTACSSGTVSVSTPSSTACLPATAPAVKPTSRPADPSLKQPQPLVVAVAAGVTLRTVSALSARTLRTRGLRVTVRCAAACTLRLRLSRAGRTLASATLHGTGALTHRLRVRRGVRSGQRLTLSVRSPSATVTRRIRIR